MRLKDVLERWGLTSLRIKTPFLEAEWKPKDADKTAAWELYVELITGLRPSGSTPTMATKRRH